MLFTHHHNLAQKVYSQTYLFGIDLFMFVLQNIIPADSQEIMHKKSLLLSKTNRQREREREKKYLSINESIHSLFA